MASYWGVPESVQHTHIPICNDPSRSYILLMLFNHSTTYFASTFLTFMLLLMFFCYLKCFPPFPHHLCLVKFFLSFKDPSKCHLFHKILPTPELSLSPLVPIAPCYRKCGSWTSRISIPLELMKLQYLWPHPRPTESNSKFKRRIPRWFIGTQKFARHCSSTTAMWQLLQWYLHYFV